MDDYQELRKKTDNLIDTFFDLHSFVENHAIYFSEDLTNKIKELNTLLFNLSIDIYYQSKRENINDFIKAFYEERDTFESQNKKIKQVIESDFRELLGVTG